MDFKLFKSSHHLLDPSRVLKNNVYFPNMCHVCRCFGEKAVNLKRCGACGILSYCGPEHQKQDWPSHKQFCKAVSKLKKNWNVSSIFEHLKSSMAKMPLKNIENVPDKLNYYNSMFSLQECLKTAISLTLQRDLEEIEKQMISFPRVCAVCFEAKSELLINCKKCPQASFCKEHVNDPNHESECIKILSFFTTIRNSIMPNDIKNCLNSTYQPKIKKLPSTTLQYIETRLLADLRNKNKFSKELEFLCTSYLSEFASRQLTLITIIEKLKLNAKKSLVIHLIGANIEEQLIYDWEMILHYLPEISELNLIFIGPEIMSETKKKNVCKQCNKNKRKLLIEPKKILYDKYISDVTFKKPDIIACFNAGFHLFSDWNSTIPIFNKAQCPLLITAVSKPEGLINKDIIDQTFPLAKCIYNDYNPYTSHFYLRRNVIVPVECKNQFMILYEYLETKTEFN
ncbi:uncharacterized protein LOC127289354 [Leptopilina boulardi]|uniref:uncharacterized protein LOC127289354 n=1 Tax=Leptopilina boulardi TaxID=63433 RepID=UPI0021F51B85|nr:uncharacterized protein LOC127289354 [Leptopilina boulardi]